MRKIILMILPYGILCLAALILGMIWWRIAGGWVQLTNSWVALFFVISFCAIFLYQEEIYHFFDHHMKNISFASGGPLQKNRHLPEIFKDDQKFQELISGTVMVWMEKVNLEKEEKKLHEDDIAQAIEQYKNTKKENTKWLFLFADCYLVQHCKDVLFEIYERHYVTEQIFHEIIDELVIDEMESDAILEALKYLRFIRRQEEEIIITETGSAYCTYLEQTVQK
jgi:hypothetical protein